MSDRPSMTVVVCCRDRAAMLKLTLVSLRDVLAAGDELLVVDSASTDPQVTLVAVSAHARVLRADRPGLARARNLGWRAARHSLIAFTDDDCRPDSGWLDALATALSEPSVGMVFGAVLPTGDGEPLSVMTADEPYVIAPHDADPVLRLGHGANFAASRSVLEAVDGFDDDLGAGSRLRAGEDTEFALRVLESGRTVAYSPAARVRHDGWRSRREALRTFTGYGVGAGAVAARRPPGLRSRQLRVELGERGLVQGWRDLRAGYQFGVIACAARTAGVVRGFMAGGGR